MQTRTVPPPLQPLLAQAYQSFSAGNLETVALALRKKYPGARIVICGDDDWLKKRNAGKLAAEKTAKAVGGILAMPWFNPNGHRPKDATDFNDQAKRYSTGDLRDVYFYRSQLNGHIEREYHPGR